MKAQAKNIVKIQNRKVNAILILLSALLLTLICLAFQPIKYTEVPEVHEVQEVQNMSSFYMEIVIL